MTYAKRFDGRALDETRPITAKVGVVPRADGSAMFQIGNTQAYAAVYGPRDLHPKFMQNPQTGILRCHYNMMPFSGHGERVRPGGGRRAREIGMVMENALLPVLNLKEYPNTVVDVFVELPQTDAGTRCAGITAAAMALADAGLEMKDLVAAVAVGRVDDKVLVDLNYNEEAYEDGPVADIPVAMLPNSGQVTLLQMDGEVRKQDLKQALELGKKVCRRIYEIQKQVLKERFKKR
ncbi:exosome complex exonuclease Rrp41 [Candidatus Woesearchaeota archaeon]|nr:exosome complex exonuclease Rrp41 [Candidatus Woesearchaeota archaeon]